MPKRLNLGGDDGNEQAVATPSNQGFDPSSFPQAPPAPSINLGAGVAFPGSSFPEMPAGIPAPVPAAMGTPFPSAMAPAQSTNAVQMKLPVTVEEIGRVGSEVQTSIATVTHKITATAKTSDMDDMGKLLSDTIMSAKGYDPDKLFKGGLFGFMKAKSQQIRLRFDTVDKTVQRLIGEVDQRIKLFRQRITDLESLAVANKKYHDDLTPQIEHINKVAEWMEVNQPQADPNDAMSGQFVQDWITVINFARKRADDLRRAQILAQQQAAQIQQMKMNSSALAQTFADIKVTTIPAMQQTFTLYILNMEAKKGAEFANQVIDTNNEVITKNAALLNQNTSEIQKAVTRPNISLATLKANHDSVINSLNEVDRIRAEMRQRIATETPQIEQLSQDLQARLAQPVAKAS